MRQTDRIAPTGLPRSRRPRTLAGLMLGGSLIVAGCGTRSLTSAAPIASKRGPARGEERVEPDVVVRRGRPAGVSVQLPMPDPTQALAFGAAVPVATTPPTTPAPPVTAATAAPAPPAPAPAEPPADAAEPEPEEEPEETAPPTTKPKKKSTTTAATAAPAPTPTPPPASPPPEDTTEPTSPPAPVRVDTGVAGRVLTLVNAQRAAAGLGAVSLSGALNNAAAGHSKDQAANSKMSHTGSNGSTMAQRCSAAGYGWRSLGENVAAGYGSADSVMNGWMNSSGHRANILNAGFVHMGVAVAYSADGTPYWTMDLGAPA